MSTKSERDKLKTQQEKFQAILSGLLKDDDNKYCVDCDAKGPRWASWNLGIFLCIRCAGIHRNLGVHITKVKSVNLDTWSPEQLAMMMEVGNSRARAAYEANIPDNYKRPQTNSGLESFIRAKYETKKYMAKEWIPPKPTVPRELVSELLEDDKDKKKSRTKATGSIQLNPAPRAQSNSTTPAVSQSSKSENKPAKSAQPKPVTAPAVVQAKPPQPSSNTADLIGLEAPAAPQQTNNNLLGDLNDFMGSGGPASPLGGGENQTVNNGQIANGGLEANLFEDMNGGSSGGGTQSKSSKDSIMALFSSGGSQQPQQFGVPGPNYISPSEAPSMYMYADQGGMYVAPQQNMGAMYGMPQQQQPQQQQQQQQQPMMSAAGNVPMQPPPMYGSQMSGQRMPANMGMQQGNMGMQQGNVGMPQGNMGMQPTMGMQQGNMGVYGQQPQMQQMQFQQMQQQMAGMQVGQGGQMMGGTGGIAQNGVPAGQGWGAPPSSGHTLQSNLWH